ncbi:regulation of nuclear pre-mRNA domain-containing protein 2 [Xenentodon cancila]
MAAGSGAASGQATRGSTAGLEASLDRRLQGVSNTMESIQGLSAWCIENKKQHGLIVRHWMKWLRKSDNNHRLNLFYLANDVIQNCKRKNAIVFRTAFSEVLPNAAQLIKDGKVRRSVERIFSIWEERSVYPEEVIAKFKASLNKKEKEREKQKEKEKEKETPPSNATTSTKAALKSKIVAEFTPQSLIEQLLRSKRAVAEEEFREKQLAALRVDVCSTEALKRLKDKAGGNKFAKDVEDGSLKLQEFVSFLEKELKTGPPLLEALGNADVFYETQYKEVKIVANAYNAFATRVTSLKRKLDSLKSTLPGPDSPIPSPSEDAPSPTGSDSPFLEMGVGRAQVDPELDGKAMDEGEMQSENIEAEDMDMSDEDMDTVAEEGDKKDKPFTAASKTQLTKLPSTPTQTTKTNACVSTTANPVTPTSTKATTAPTTPLGVNLAKVDLGKISSILSSLTSAMKNTAPSPSPRPSPGTPTTPTGQSATSKAAPPSPALASILSRVDITPEGILSALSKTNTPALSSLLQSVTNNSSAPSARTSPETASVKNPLTPTTPKTKPNLGNSLKCDTPGGSREWERERQLSPPPPPPPSHPSAPSVSPPSLESKINSFLQGNPGFSLALGDVSPDGVDGTPVRDEAAGTPTQDEIMDTPGSVPESLGPSGLHKLSPTAYRRESWDAALSPSGGNSDGDFLVSSSSRYGAGKKSSTKLKDDDAKKRISPSLGNDMKGLKDEQHSQLRIMGNKGVGERRHSAGSRKVSTGSVDGSTGKREDKGKNKMSPGRDGEDGQVHRIETLVSPHTEGAPIQTLGYSNRPLAGEPIKTVESIRVIGRGSRRGGGAGSRPGASVWYEEEEYMGAQPPPSHILPPPLNIGQGGAEDMTPSMPPPPPPLPHLLVPHLHPPPPLPLPHPPPQTQFSMPYHTENIQTPPPSNHQQHPPLTPPFFGRPPPIPRPPPPPPPQHLSPPPTLPSAVMVGGVMVSVDRPLSLLPPIRLEGPDRGGVGPRGSKVAPLPLMSSLLGEPPKLPRPGTVKEPFVPRHTPPLHRPGTPGLPPPLLGRVKEPLPSSSPSPTSSTTSPSTPNSPAVDTTPVRSPVQSAGLPPQKPPASPPAQPRNQASNPVPLLNLPSPRPPILSTPMSQRHPLRGRTPSQDLSRGGFHGGKRAGPPFAGGPFHAQKRPFLPPRY